MIITRCADWAGIHRGKRPVIWITHEYDLSNVVISDGMCAQCLLTLKVRNGYYTQQPVEADVAARS
jgi:hypothetical protein